MSDATGNNVNNIIMSWALTTEFNTKGEAYTNQTDLVSDQKLFDVYTNTDLTFTAVLL